MNYFLHTGNRPLKQHQRLKLILREAERIRKLHEAGKISANEASKLLMELRQNPEPILDSKVREAG